jgi:c-di-AMP phosphodiesterase-like protein
MAKKIILGISHTEWHYVLISILFLILPIVTIIPTGFPTWIMGCIVLFLLAVWFAFILYLLLFSFKFTMEQDKEMKLVKSIEKYFIKVLEDVEWTDDTVNMVIDALYDWTRLAQEEKYDRY